MSTPKETALLFIRMVRGSVTGARRPSQFIYNLENSLLTVEGLVQNIEEVRPSGPESAPEPKITYCGPIKSLHEIKTK